VAAPSDIWKEKGLTLIESQDGGGSAFAPSAVTIPAGYKDIVVTGSVFTNAVATYDYPEIIVNGDTDNNHYAKGHLTQRGTAINGYESLVAYAHAFGTCTPSATTGVPCVFRLIIPDYAGTVSQKQILAHSAWNLVASSVQYNDTATILWENTAAITSVSFGSTEDASLYGAGSSFSVWVR